MMHGNDSQYCWSDLFQDMRQWQCATLGIHDVQLLPLVINVFWCPDQGISPYGACAGVMSVQGWGSHAVARPKTSLPRSSGLVDVLKDGIVIRECSKLLNSGWLSSDNMCLRIS